MEFASCGELFEHIVANQRVKEPEACKFIQQILFGIQYFSDLKNRYTFIVFQWMNN